jgi:hypothetical protein
MDFSTFLALMYLRAPAMRRMNAEMISRHLQIRCYAYGINEKAFDTLTRLRGLGLFSMPRALPINGLAGKVCTTAGGWGRWL